MLIVPRRRARAISQDAGKVQAVYADVYANFERCLIGGFRALVWGSAGGQ